MIVIRPLTVLDAMLTASNVPETDYTAWNAATNYSVGAYCIRTTATTHKVYKCLVAGVDATAPEGNPTKWLDYSPTNRWACFDQRTGTQTQQADSITYTIVPGAAISSIAFINLSAASVRIKLTDPVDGVVYDTTTSTTVGALVGDWDSYFFDSVARKTDMVVQGIPSYPAATVDITITHTGSTAKVGVIALGRAIELGSAEYGANFGITDYSVKALDDFGGYTITKRAFSKRAAFNLKVPTEILDSVAALLTELRSTPCVWVGHADYQGTIVYGFYKDFDIVISYPTWNDCKLEIEGLT